MSTISSALNSYYQYLNNSSGSSTSTAAVSSSSLADALNTLAGGSNSGDAYSLNLSSSAQNYLSGSTSSSDSFTLTTAQQKTIHDVLAKYKDAPYTSDTLNSIMSDLKAAGVGTSQLSLEDKIRSFNPTSQLLSALNGTSTDIVTQQANSDSDEQTKSDNYTKSIISQWQKISTTYSSTTTAS